MILIFVIDVFQSSLINLLIRNLLSFNQYSFNLLITVFSSIHRHLIRIGIEHQVRINFGEIIFSSFYLMEGHLCLMFHPQIIKVKNQQVTLQLHTYRIFIIFCQKLLTFFNQICPHISTSTFIKTHQAYLHNQLLNSWIEY